ncbi:hypothetical protein BDV59DRAFT_121998 [Aspergillus ambiguus]|uniref:gamma-glutamylcyclotransferase family protein n=1 Tax=Aspergillus ambiguus TaxID=176160 RepID=UPI003CCCDBA9
MSEIIRPRTIRKQNYYHCIENQENREYLERPLRRQEALFFLYDSLMDPSILARVLKRSELPKLYPATIYNYKTMLSWHYPALAPGSSEDVVRGFVCKINSEEEVNRLEAYETGLYYRSRFTARLDDGTQVRGGIFKWGGGQLCLREGRFNLQEFLQQQNHEKPNCVVRKKRQWAPHRV